MTVMIATVVLLCILIPDFSYQSTSLLLKKDSRKVVTTFDEKQFQNDIAYIDPSNESSITLWALSEINDVSQISTDINVITMSSHLSSSGHDRELGISSTPAKSFTSMTAFEIKSVSMSMSFHRAALTRSSSKMLYTPDFKTDVTFTTSVASTTIPDKKKSTSIDFKLIICICVPLCAVLVFVIVVAVVLCVRRYKKLRRYRQHLVPLTDMDGSDDSDEEDQIADKEPVFMVSSVNSSTRPILSFENEND